MLLTSLLAIATSITGWEIGRKIGSKLYNRSGKTQQKSVEVIDAEVVEEGPYRTNAFVKDASGFLVAQTLKSPPRIDWAWNYEDGQFRCPKCKWGQGKEDEHRKLAYCICDETEHFHFKCNTCGFTALMETADKSK